jgi:AcrR family transcriptional regulator
VIAAAVRVFAADGYRSARMSDVAREAGLSEAALYRYVDGKEDLFVLAIRSRSSRRRRSRASAAWTSRRRVTATAPGSASPT